MEHFNTKTNIVYGGTHKLAPPVFTLDAETKASFNLQPNVCEFRVEHEDKYWVAHFEGWHGAHALFYVPKRHNYIAVWHEKLRDTVKRIKNHD